jgi:hypothetical protein
MASDSETSDEGSLNGHDDKGVSDEDPGSETDGIVDSANDKGSTRASKGV